MKWKQPPIIKIYEALGAIADGRVEVDGNAAKVFSSSGNKFYEVAYEPETHAIMANDNGSYWKGYLGYPAIAFLFANGALDYRADLAALLKGIAWKDLNQKFKNDFDKTITFIFSKLSPADCATLEAYATKTLARINALNLSHLGPKALPPAGY